MKTKILSAVVLISVFSLGASVRAVTVARTVNAPAVSGNQFETIAFSDSAEAGMLHRAYRILATGDHDYKGHRVKALHAVKAAADLLGLDLRGDDKNREKQVLSDEKLREASGLLTHVLDSSEVKGEKRITKHITEAIDQINIALSQR